MNNRTIMETPMAAATAPTTSNRTGSWRFEKPVFTEGIAPCSEACPVAVDIATVLTYVRAGQMEQAYKKIYTENPFPGVCGQICFFPCERVCNRGRFDEPISIKAIEKFAAQWARENHLCTTNRERTNNQSVAVIGCDPAGLSCSFFLNRLGYRISAFDVNYDSGSLLNFDRHIELDMELVEWELNKILNDSIVHRRKCPENMDRLLELLNGFAGIYLSGDVLNGFDENTSAKLTDLGIVCVFGPKSNKHIKNGNETKHFVRSLGIGKKGAMELDMALKHIPPESIHRYAVGKIGHVSYERYHNSSTSTESDRIEPVIRYGDLNTAYFKKKEREDIFKQEEAIKEADRCFSCGKCTFCYNCADFCPDLSITVDRNNAYRKIDYDYCKGCGICVKECPRKAIILVKE